jgi:hypothetical protein
MSKDNISSLWAIECALEVIYDHLYNNKPVAKNCITGYIKEALVELDLVSDVFNIRNSKSDTLRDKLKQSDIEFEQTMQRIRDKNELDK